jgi:uncharacterized protein (TIGR02598 family)
MIERRLTNNGFSLVEITLALGVMAFCLVAIAGLLPVGFTTTRSSSEETLASDLINAIDADLRTTPTTASQSPSFKVSTSGESTFYIDNSGSVVPENSARFRVYAQLTPAASGTKTATFGRIVVSWPAQQDDIAKAAGSIEAHVALDRN